MQQVNMAKSIKNDAWISKEEIPNPDMLPDLPGYHILVRPVSVKEKTIAEFEVDEDEWEDYLWDEEA